MTLYQANFGPIGDDTNPDAYDAWQEFHELLRANYVVPVEPDEIKAADAFNAEMVRITGKSSSVEMRAIHAALCAGIEGDDE